MGYSLAPPKEKKRKFGNLQKRMGYGGGKMSRTQASEELLIPRFKHICFMKAGQAFGDIALLQNKPRTARIICK